MYAYKYRTSKAESEIWAKEWVRLNGFGVTWDILGFFLFIVSSWNNAMHKVSDSVQKQSSTTWLVYLPVVLVPIQIVLIHQFGTPGIFMSQQLKIYINKSVAGMLIYLLILLVSIVSSSNIFNFLAGQEDSLCCAVLTLLYVYFYSTFLLRHGSAAMVLFPLKVLFEQNKPPCDSKTELCLKFCTLVSIEALIYIVAINHDKNYNHATKLLSGDPITNRLTKDAINVTQMIIFPVSKMIFFIFLLLILTTIGYLIVQDCIVQPAIALVRRNRFVLPRNVLHLE